MAKLFITIKTNDDEVVSIMEFNSDIWFKFHDTIIAQIKEIINNIDAAEILKKKPINFIKP
jgi:hypothetical protein